MAFFVTSNEESGKAGRVLQACALFAPFRRPMRRRHRRRRHRRRRWRLPRWRRRDGRDLRCDAHPSPNERHDASRIPRDAAHCKSSCVRPSRAVIALFVVASPSPFSPPSRQRYNRCIDVSNLSARDAAAAAAAAAAIAAANCIDAQRLDAARSNSWHNSHAGFPIIALFPTPIDYINLLIHFLIFRFS